MGFFDLLAGWEPVAGPAEGYPYEVHPEGRVRHAESGKALNPYPGGPEGEYARVDLRAPGRDRLQVYVHQLVAWTHLGRQPAGMVVHHKNGNTRDNDFLNLEYMETQENAQLGRSP